MGLWKIILLGLLIFLQVSLMGQSERSNSLMLRAAYRPGYVLPEYSLFPYLVDDYVRSFHVSVSSRAYGQNYWAQLYGYPEWGVALQYGTLGNHDVFGEEVSVFPFVGLPLLQKGRFMLWNQLGFGVGYATEKYDPEKNPNNVAVGSHLNVHFNFEINAQYNVVPDLAVYTGICFDHLSNGNLGEPNLGINVMTLNAGVRYNAGTYHDRIRYTLEKHIPSDQFAVLVNGGVKHARALQSKTYPIAGLSFEYRRKIWRTVHLGAGADLFYDGSAEVEIRAFGDAPYHPGDEFKSGIHLSQALVYNKFSIALQEGWYVGLKDKAFGNATYHRFIIRHQIGDRFFAQIAMKAHVAVLDYLEFGAGYLIKP